VQNHEDVLVYEAYPFLRDAAAAKHAKVCPCVCALGVPSSVLVMYANSFVVGL
jgi:hypothetical protein